MIVIWILLGVAVLLAVLLLAPVRVEILFHEELRASIRYLFFRYQIFPKKKIEKKPNKKPAKDSAVQEKQKQEKPEEENYEKVLEALREKGLSGFLGLLRSAASAAAGAAKKLVSHVVIQRMDLSVRVSTGDAADTAILYGYACGAIATALGAILPLVSCREYHVQVDPDFDEKESLVNFEAEVRLRPVYAITTSFGLLRYALSVWREL